MHQNTADQAKGSRVDAPIPQGENCPLLAVDVGNSNIVIGCFEGVKLLCKWRIHSHPARSEDEYYGILQALLTECGYAQPQAVVISSVVPQQTVVWQKMFAQYWALEATIINALSPLGLRYKVADPSFIGSDLVTNAFAAISQYQQSAIIIDLGTASTVQMVTSEGSFEGTAIIAGIQPSLQALTSRAAQLANIEITAPPALIGTNTRDAMLSGVVNSHVFALDNFVRQLRLQYFDKTPIVTILTGGWAALMQPLMPFVDVVEPNLTLNGLALAYHKLASGALAE